MTGGLEASLGVCSQTPCAVAGRAHHPGTDLSSRLFVAVFYPYSFPLRWSFFIEGSRIPTLCSSSLAPPLRYEGLKYPLVGHQVERLLVIYPHAILRSRVYNLASSAIMASMTRASRHSLWWRLRLFCASGRISFLTRWDRISSFIVPVKSLYIVFRQVIGVLSPDTLLSGSLLCGPLLAILVPLLLHPGHGCTIWPLRRSWHR